jgi:hypothetical protein
VTFRRAAPLAILLAVILTVLLAVLAPRTARAYRPFDQTDADVAEWHTVELELGPLTYTWAPSGDAYAPGFIFNYGFAHGFELVFDASKAFLFGSPQVDAGRRQLDSELSVKGVLRDGSLQGGTGVSVACEAGVLLPALPIAGGVGAALTFIASQRWPALSIHLNAEGDLRRDGGFAFIGGGIIEGPDAWALRPVGELLFAEEADQPATFSGLGGAIWRASPSFIFDAAVRLARQDAERVVEVRAGLTWVIGN